MKHYGKITPSDQLKLGTSSYRRHPMSPAGSETDSWTSEIEGYMKNSLRTSVSSIISESNGFYVTFKVKYKTYFGQNLAIIGSCKELGNW